MCFFLDVLYKDEGTLLTNFIKFMIFFTATGGFMHKKSNPLAP